MDKNVKIGIIGAVVTLIICIIVVGSMIIEKITPSKAVMELSEYYEVPEGEALVILDDVKYEKYAKVIDGVYYMDLETITTKFNKRFYFDYKENVLVYTTPTQIIKAEVGSNDYSINKNKETVGYVVVKRDVDEVFVALDFVAGYSDMKVSTYENPHRIKVEATYKDYQFATVKTATQIRTKASIKSDILRQMKKDEEVMIINNGGDLADGFITVMSEDLVRGYIQKKAISDMFDKKISSTFTAPEYTSMKKEASVNLTWHQVTNQEANDNLVSLLERTKGVTTISPTWFRVNSEEGTLASLASESYVESAHGMNVEVWALVDNFDTNVDIHKVLSKTSSREKLVNEIMAQAIKCNLDGINIDFENLMAETGPHYIQFLRELSVKCRTNQIVLSADSYVPASYNKFYDYKEQGVILDYVVIMGYDEHHGNSEEAGSVSSLGFFKEAIRATLEMVPKDKMIMGIPYYTRLWKEYVELGEQKLSSDALGMRDMDKILKDNGVTPEFNEEAGQYYAEYQKGDATYKVWLEEEESIDAKMKQIYEAKLAGVASWRLGFEKTSIWDVILKYMN